ncbi:MAG: hypothetical protein HOP23_01860 [Methylococcaceae bacterium]|nr:hypothetical protein [Methylococcaceae bacterium]
MILIADCSALVALAICDGLHLLEQLFDTVGCRKPFTKQTLTKWLTDLQASLGF